MALRISNKEREQIRNLNARAQRKGNRLYKTYGLKKFKFKTLKVNDFTSRQQLNQYKQEIHYYLRPSTHRYVRGGLVSQKGNLYYYPIPREDVWEIKSMLRRRNKAIDRFNRKFGNVTVDVRGRKQDFTLKTLIAQRTDYNKATMNTKYSSYKKMKFDPKLITSKKSYQRFKYGSHHYQSVKGIKRKQKIAFENYLTALYNTFGSNARPIINALENLTLEEFIAFFESDTFVDFGYVYDVTQANQILQGLAQHFLNFVQEQNIEIEEVDKMILESTLNLDSQSILAKYNQGAYGGERIIFEEKTPDGRTKQSSYYVDLTPEESEIYRTYGQNLAMLYEILTPEEFNRRKKVLFTRHYTIKGKKNGKRKK